MLMTIQYYRTAIQNQNQNQNQNQFEIIGNSGTVPVPEFQSTIFSSRWRTHEPLVSSQEIFLRIRSLDQEFPRGVARARHARARVTCATEHPGSLA